MSTMHRERCDTLVLAALEASPRTGEEILGHLARTARRIARGAQAVSGVVGPP